MKRLLASVSAILMLCAAQPSVAAFKDSTSTLRVGNWTVWRSIDPMTDAVDCTGVYKTNFGIQLVKGDLFIKLSGGLRSVTLRFGDAPAQSLRMAEESEKSLDAVDLTGSEFDGAVATNRLRLEVMTLVSGVKNMDLDTTGIQSALEHIRAGCPLPAGPSAAAAVPAAAEPGEPGDAPPACSKQMIGRLRGAGVSAKQIAAACRPQP